MTISTRKLHIDEIRTLAIPLAWDVFQKTEGLTYPESGKTAFYNAINDNSYVQSLTVYGAFDSDNLVGIIATREHGSHIALFFIQESHRGKGIGRMLWNTLVSESTATRITVHSSVYAKDIYAALGFKEEGEATEQDGIRFVPMVFSK